MHTTYLLLKQSFVERVRTRFYFRGLTFLTIDKKIFKQAQDNRSEYENGVTICRFTQLSDTAYDETPVMLLTIAGHKGPHTQSTDSINTYIDFYSKGFEPLTWLARVKTKIKGNNVYCP